MTEIATIEIKRLHDKDGNPTCCTRWGDNDNTCPLLRVSGLLAWEHCNWTDDRIYRRGELGTLIPVAGCPVHETKT